MHIPPLFAENAPSEIRILIAEHPLATVVYRVGEAMEAQHIPLIFDGENKLIGHIASNNEIATQLRDGDSVLAIFSGQDSYISPNWYPSKAIHHKHVPTWNYQVVHAKGQIAFRDDKKTKLSVVGRMTKHFETLVNGKTAWKMADAPREYLEAMLDHIIAIELSVDSIIGKSKVSQNREVADFDSVLDEMSKNGKHELAGRMKRFKDE